MLPLLTARTGTIKSAKIILCGVGRRDRTKSLSLSFTIWSARFVLILQKEYEALNWEEQLKKAPWQTLQRLWIMEHFRALPTDPRIEELSDDQISLLMTYWLNNDERDIKVAYLEQKAKEEAEKQKPVFKADELREIGYSEAEIKEMTRGQ
jgi:hypothetical protein